MVDYVPRRPVTLADLCSEAGTSETGDSRGASEEGSHEDDPPPPATPSRKVSVAQRKVEILREKAAKAAAAALKQKENEARAEQGRQRKPKAKTLAGDQRCQAGSIVLMADGQPTSLADKECVGEGHTRMKLLVDDAEVSEMTEAFLCAHHSRKYYEEVQSCKCVKKECFRRSTGAPGEAEPCREHLEEAVFGNPGQRVRTSQAFKELELPDIPAATMDIGTPLEEKDVARVVENLDPTAALAAERMAVDAMSQVVEGVARGTSLQGFYSVLQALAVSSPRLLALLKSHGWSETHFKPTLDQGGAKKLQAALKELVNGEPKGATTSPAQSTDSGTTLSWVAVSDDKPDGGGEAAHTVN